MKKPKRPSRSEVTNLGAQRCQQGTWREKGRRRPIRNQEARDTLALSKEAAASQLFCCVIEISAQCCQISQLKPDIPSLMGKFHDFQLMTIIKKIMRAKATIPLDKFGPWTAS